MDDPCWQQLPRDCVREIFHWLRPPKGAYPWELREHVARVTRTAKWLPRPSSQQLFEQMVQCVDRNAHPEYGLLGLGNAPSGFVYRTSRHTWPRDLMKLHAAFAVMFPRVRVKYREKFAPFSYEMTSMLARRPDLRMDESIFPRWPSNMVLFVRDNKESRA